MKSEDLGLISEELLALEKSGEYDIALEQVRSFWTDWNTIPSFLESESNIEAELILRCGSLLGFLGHVRQTSNAQETSRDLLTEAHRRFTRLDNDKKAGECENYLALSYWRTGEFSEAETFVAASLARNLPDSSHIRLYSVLIQAMIYDVTDRSSLVVDQLNNAREQFLEYADAYLLGNFFTNLGLALKNTGRTQEAIDNLESGRRYYRDCGHQIYLGIVENNLAQVYKREARFFEAHKAVEGAIRIYEDLGDRARKGSSLDTKAQIFFEEGEYKQGLETIDQALAILESGENTAYLTEAHFTKAKLLVLLDQLAAASGSLYDAMQLARTNVGVEAGERLAKEFEIVVRKKSLPQDLETQMRNKIYEGDMELILPPSLSNYDDYQVIRIRNSHLEQIGINKDSLAVVVEDTIKRGDLVALTEIADDAVICGFYDYFAGIVSITGMTSETLLFKSEEVKLVGKIIGVGDREPGSDGMIHIKPVEI